MMSRIFSNFACRKLNVRMMKRLLLSFVGLLTMSMACAQNDKMNKYIDNLMARMTLEEKIGQLNLISVGDINTGAPVDSEAGALAKAGKLGAVLNLKGVNKIKALQQVAVEQSRLGIPLIVGLDVVHGYETVFPIPLALSCSWDVDAVETMARISAKEATADGISWTYSPMVDIALDARWGRIAEGNGEDPFLGSEMAKAYVRGYQGSPTPLLACVKHYALYGAVEAGRDYNTVDMSHLRMYNQYFPPYRAAAEAGAASFMSSFNLVDGQHATANRWLLTEVLRNQWKWNGFVVTDYGSIGEMTIHGFGDKKTNAMRALKAGTDMDMCALAFIETLAQSVAEGKVSEAEINQACRRILEAKYKMGLFEDPYRYCDPNRRAADIYTQENRDEARRIATETFVLLKNSAASLPSSPEGEGLLPLTLEKLRQLHPTSPLGGKEGGPSVALIGPLADTRNNIVGCWAFGAAPEKYKTLKECMAHALDGKGRLLYAQGSNITRDEALQLAAEFGKSIPRGDDALLKAEALEVARQADVIVCAMGECADFSGESSSRSNLEMPDVQHELLQELVTLGKPVVLLNFAGRPTVLTWEQAHVDAILNVWFAGSETGDAICDVLFGDVNPSGKLTTSFPQCVGQLPLYYNHLPTGRPVPEGTDHYFKYHSNYLDVRNDPLYPFGYGLSYTSYIYSDVTIEGMTASVTVTNSGQRDGDEIVQLYINDPVCSISRPVKELKGFRRIHLKAGESKRISFDITRDMLSYYNAEGDLIFEPGDFNIMIGPNSRDVRKAVLRLEI